MTNFTQTYKEVTKDDFDKFLTHYHKPLARHLVKFTDPAYLTYIDGSKAWPQSMVAGIQMGYELKYFVEAK